MSVEPLPPSRDPELYSDRPKKTDEAEELPKPPPAQRWTAVNTIGEVHDSLPLQIDFAHLDGPSEDQEEKKMQDEGRQQLVAPSGDKKGENEQQGENAKRLKLR